MKRFFSAVLFISFISINLQAADLQPEDKPGAGSVAYTSGDFATAMKEWQPLAEQGDAKAQYNLAVLYSRGQGVTQDNAEATKWLQKAADQGDTRAAESLGDVFHEQKNFPEALKWYQKAADAGDAFAEFHLGVMYDLGEGVPENFPEALNWYKKAAEQNNAPALCNIAVLYYNGQGVPVNRLEAHRYFLIAAQMGEPRAKDLIQLTTEKLTKKQIEQAVSEADEWMRDHASLTRAGI